MAGEFHQQGWDEHAAEQCRRIVRCARSEDLCDQHDWTTLALVPSDRRAMAHVLARGTGVIAGLPAATLAAREFDEQLEFQPQLDEGAVVTPGRLVAILSGPVRSMLTAERTILNLLGRLSGIATRTSLYVAAVAGTKARIYDTRKTTPGWRRLEKYAVRQGGGWNHRSGLFDAILIKDNHLAQAAGESLTPADAVCRARQLLSDHFPDDNPHRRMPVEVEVDTLAQLENALAASPDIVLLDNMSLETLGEAVAMRDARAPAVQLEASGGVSLATVAAIAATGVDRISVGALTHSGAWLDIGLDWDVQTDR